jgi:Protein of unknown function (DUF1203)
MLKLANPCCCLILSIYLGHLLIVVLDRYSCANRQARTYSKINEIPEVLRVAARLFSVRAYDETDMLVDAEVIESVEIDASIQRLFANASIAYVHVHNAGPGCYSCRIDRA